VNLRSFKDDLTRHLPSEWQVLYGWVKKYLFSPHTESAPKPASWSEEFTTNRITILTSCFVIVAGVALRTYLPRELSLGPLFVFGCAFPSLVINRRWRTLAAILCTVLLSLTKIFANHAPLHIDVFFWNVAMRFLFFEFYVLVFDCIRRLAHDSSASSESLSTSSSA